MGVVLVRIGRPNPNQPARRPHMSRAPRLASVTLVVALAGGGVAKLLGGSEHRPPSRASARLFSAESVWNQPVRAGAALDPRSSARVSALVSEIKAAAARNVFPGVAAGSYSTPIYVVQANQRRVPVTLDTRRGGAPLRAALAHGVPIPARARPARGTDGHLTVYQPATDTLWEFWRAVRRADGWHASWGGAMRHVSTNGGFYSSSSWPGLRPNDGWNWGATASSLPVAAGVVTAQDMQRRRIDHALAASTPVACAGLFAWPAQRTDGGRQGPDCIPEGARLRLDPALDVNALHLSTFARMLAHAAQKYGIIVRDTTSTTFSFYAEDAATAGTTVYAAKRSVWAGVPAWKALYGFPWHRLQVLAMRLCRTAPCRGPKR